MVAIGPNGAIDGGAVYAVLHNGSVFSATYTFYVSSDGGATWTFKSSQNFANYVGSNVNGRHSVQNMRTRPYPFIAADNSPGTYRGRFYLVYASNNPAGNGNKPDIFCRYSNDQGETWSSAITVNDDVNSQSHNQWHPSIWSDKQTGR
jgi:Neuraminidase (sialidase)